MEIGIITEVKKDESRLVCRVQFGENDYCTAILYGLASQNEYPMIDDEVAVNRSDEENIIIAVYRPIPDGISAGESITYGRDGDGVIVSSTRHGSDGSIYITNESEKYVVTGSGNDFVAMSKKVDDYIASLDSAIRTFTPIPQDGGAAFQTTYKTKVPTAPSTMASANLKAD